MQTFTEKSLRMIGRPTLMVVALVLLTASHALAQDDLRTLRAKAIRSAAERVVGSIVRVEKFGVAEAGGEVADDAPTVAVAIDNARHFIASSLVRRQTPASIVLVASDGRRSAAKIVASDERRQLVLLESAEDLMIRPIELANTDSQVGETVIAVGQIAGDGSTAVSSGVLSAKERLWGIALQTDARVSSVFYGGPLVNLRGDVLGILVPAVPDDMGEDVTAWYDAGVAFAIPSEDIAERLSTLTGGKDIKAGLAGIVAKTNDPYIESTDIASVVPRSPAARADLQAGDVVKAVDRQSVRSHREIKQILGKKDAGQTVRFTVTRGDKTLDKELMLAESIPPLTPQWIGVTVEDIASVEGEAAPIGVRVTGVFEKSPAKDKLQVDDVIRELDDKPIPDASTLRKRIFTADPERPLNFEISRGQDAKSDALTVQVTSSPLAGPSVDALPSSLTYTEATPVQWVVRDFAIPDLGNKTVLVAPEINDDRPAETPPLGLLVLLSQPGETDLTKIGKMWLDRAKKHGVIVCIAAPAKEDRWQPEEIDAGARIVTAISNRYAVNSQMVAVSGTASGAGSSMAMAVAIARAGTFRGLAVTSEVTPPAIRLRENDPQAPVQVLLRTDEASEQDSPAWLGVLEKAGYVVIRGAAKDDQMLDWVRSLPRI